MSNTLLHLNDVPRFNQLNANEVVGNLTALIIQARQEISVIKTITPINWENIMDPLTSALERVSRAWGLVVHIDAVINLANWHHEYNKMIPVVSEFYTGVSQDLELFQILKNIQYSCFNSLTEAQQQKLKYDLRDFELSGATLALEPQKQLTRLNTELSLLASQFSQNVLDATDSFVLYIDDVEVLTGVTQDDLDLFRSGAKLAGQPGYQIKLQFPYYVSIMKFAENRVLREKIHYAYATRASELFEHGQWDNTENINAILAKRGQQAKLLGYTDYADLSLVTKMATDSQQVIQLIETIVSKAKPIANAEMDELQQFAQEYLCLDELLPWDVMFASEKLKQAKYAFSEEEVKKYFNCQQVIIGLFQLINELYGVIFEEEIRVAWHPSVRYFRLLKHKQEIGSIYMDLYARDGKKSGAWMDEYCGRWKTSDYTRLPIAYLVCNFTPSDSPETTYFNHQEVVTLFHEMGHCLHHLLTQIDELGVSGISGVEWDAVELPSQLMECFAWEFDVLVLMSDHQTTGQSLPKSLFDKMRQAKNFQVGMSLLRQMECSLFDMKIHSQIAQPCDWAAILQEVKSRVAVVPQVSYDRFPQSFEHIFAGSYSAGYYSYIWSELLAADVYESFLASNNRAQTGQKFWQEILSKGGSRPAMESFVAFRGRTPKVDYLLKHLGLPY